MDVDAVWFKSPASGRILSHWTDSRAAWLWSADGQSLYWRNAAARLFNARLKKSGLKLGADAVPIKGQIARLIRLGSPGRSSLSRLQFLAGERPLSATCTVTPLDLGTGVMALLIVAVDPVGDEIIAAASDLPADPVGATLFPHGADYLLRDAAGQVLGGSPLGLSRLASLVTDDNTSVELDGVSLSVTMHEVGPGDATLLLFVPPPRPSIESVRAADGLVEFAPRASVIREEPLLPLGLPPLVAEPEAPAPAGEEPWVEPITPAPEHTSLSSLFDQLASQDEVYSEFTDAEEAFAAAAELDASDDPLTPPEALADPEAVERVSRYNFDELSRILTDRVSADPVTATEPVEIDTPIEPPRREPPREGLLINLAAETFILNRLPIGILVFRDQQVMFANRALTDLTGYESIDALRSAGLAAIFPVDPAEAGPVTHLVRRDGALLPVTARLQSVTWQGRPALLLSASLAEPLLGHEGAVRAFAEALAEVRAEGFVTADRAGLVTRISLPGRLLLGLPDGELVGMPLTALADPAESNALRDFLEQPARFAETARPGLVARSNAADSEILVFAEGQAGIVSGYFGFIRRRKVEAAPTRDTGSEIEPSMLARVSRGVRRPLNTVIGFADLIRSSAFGSIENQRYLEYARDIKTAGEEIAVLIDELDDYARLKEGRYATRPADVDLGELLASCVVRVRGQANAARVLVRSAISERLPRIRADQPSLSQAVLNLLASAIDQTPPGGSVILSAQFEEDGSVAVNIRDSGESKVDLGERFVVFRDGIGKDGEMLTPVRSSVGLALTRSLLAVNACSLSVGPSGGVGTLFSLVLPADAVAQHVTSA